MKLKSTESSAERNALASTKADLRELRGNSSATVKELNEFLRQLKGKSPQEMLGVVTASGLVRSLVLSTALVFAAILIFTAIPYFFGGKKEQAAAEITRSPAAPPAAPQQSVSEPDAQPDAPSTLGIGEELAAPPNVNPLENAGDDFLKDLE